LIIKTWMEICWFSGPRRFKGDRNAKRCDLRAFVERGMSVLYVAHCYTYPHIHDSSTVIALLRIALYL
jgi:hypothetical protein